MDEEIRNPLPQYPERNSMFYTFLALAAAMNHDPYSFVQDPVYETKRQETRPCLYCGKPHNNNNSFCSRECCRDWEKREKEKKANEK